MKESLELRTAKQREAIQAIKEGAMVVKKRMMEHIEARRKELAANARAKEEEEAYDKPQPGGQKL